MDFDHGSGSSKFSRTHSEANISDDDPSALDLRLGGSSSSASSSSSDSLLDNIFHVDAAEIMNSSTCTPASFNPDKDALPALKVDAMFSPNANEDTQQTLQGDATFSPKLDGNAQPELQDDTIASPKPDDEAQLALEDDRSDVSSNNSSKSEEPDKESLGPSSPLPVSDLTHESLIHIMSPTQSPPIQVMERSGHYEPDRIPSSVFARSKSITPLEWSVASNDSLFSIQVGNNSFSRDHIFTLGGEIGKSGDLTRSGEFIMFSPTLPVTVGDGDRRTVDMGKKVGATGVADEAIKDVTKETSEDQSEEKIPPPKVSWNSSSVSRHSDGSATSTCSFAFPIKKKHSWPSCYCSNCSWAFCYCWNCSQKIFCCISSTILTEGGKSGSVKVEHEQQPPQPQAIEVTSNSASSKWFPCFTCFSCSSCFSCCPHCGCRCC